MPELDDARSLELVNASDLASDDVFSFFSGSRNRVVGVTGAGLRTVNEDTPTYAVAATGTLTYAGNPVNEDTIVITNGTITETFRFMDTAVLPTDIQIDATVTDTLAAAQTLISAVSVLVNANEATSDLEFTAVTPGASGNDIEVNGTDTTGDGNLTGGADASPTVPKNTIVADDDFLYVARSAITASSTSGWYKATLASL